MHEGAALNDHDSLAGTLTGSPIAPSQRAFSGAGMTCTEVATPRESNGSRAVTARGTTTVAAASFTQSIDVAAGRRHAPPHAAKRCRSAKPMSVIEPDDELCAMTLEPDGTCSEYHVEGPGRVPQLAVSLPTDETGPLKRPPVLPAVAQVALRPVAPMRGENQNVPRASGAPAPTAT